MKLISEKELRELLKASEKLYRLEVWGVDNWEGYGEALTNPEFDNDLIDWEKEDLDSLVAEYPDHTITEFDNYNYD